MRDIMRNLWITSLLECVSVVILLTLIAGKKNGKGKVPSKQREIEFATPMKNVTIQQGHDAHFSCKVSKVHTTTATKLQVHTSPNDRLTWETKNNFRNPLPTSSILRPPVAGKKQEKFPHVIGSGGSVAIEKQIVQDNPRISVHQHERLEFTLHIKNVQPDDSGIYACRFNTKPLAQLKAALDVLVPPEIISADTTETILAHEENDVTLKCKATGHPSPVITWEREDGGPMRTRGHDRVRTYRGSVLHIPKIKRAEMGTYICMASNGVPPAKSQRISVNVEFTPKIWVEPRYMGVWKGDSIELKCEVEAFPAAAMQWYQDSNVLSNSDKFDIRTDTSNTSPPYRKKFTLTIKKVDENDYKHTYRCSAGNHNGKTEEIIKLLEKELPRYDADFNSVLYDGQQMDEDALASNAKGSPKRKSPNGLPRLSCSWRLLTVVLLFGLIHLVRCRTN